jgi:hypothetical protein
VNDNSIDIQEELRPLIQTIAEYTYIGKNIHFYRDVYAPLKYYPKSDNFMLICISGGKDSIATAKYYKDLGYTIMLYHMHGINKAYHDEYTVIPKIAELLDCKYFIQDVYLKGSHMYIEHPMKNMLIANGAIQFCLTHNLPINLAFGNYSESRLDDMEFNICAGDSRDMWDIYEKIIQNEIPDFKIYTPLKNVKETYEILIEEQELFKNSMSCISPFRFRKYWAKRTENKYGVRLMPNRCGCCWKCCFEYMVLADSGMSYNREYYMHCWEILKKTARKETGLNLTDQEIWDRYFWYDANIANLKNLENFRITRKNIYATFQRREKIT